MCILMSEVTGGEDVVIHVLCQSVTSASCVCTCSARSASQSTLDSSEVRRFQPLASKWWDEEGEFAALHAMNDLRVPFVRYVSAAPVGFLLLSDVIGCEEHSC